MNDAIDVSITTVVWRLSNNLGSNPGGSYYIF
jgi:hypothetical protein